MYPSFVFSLLFQYVCKVVGNLLDLMTLKMGLPEGFSPLNTHNHAKTLGMSENSNKGTE